MFVARYEGARYVLCLYIDPATNQLGKWVYIFAEWEIMNVVKHYVEMDERLVKTRRHCP